MKILEHSITLLSSILFGNKKELLERKKNTKFLPKHDVASPHKLGNSKSFLDLNKIKIKIKINSVLLPQGEFKARVRFTFSAYINLPNFHPLYQFTQTHTLSLTAKAKEKLSHFQFSETVRSDGH